MFCQKCGNPMPDTANFCEKCGARAGEEFSSSTIKTAGSPEKFNYIDFTSDKKIKKRKKTIALICVVLALAVALIAGTLIIQATPANRLKRQLRLAEKYLTEMNYEQALIAYNEAIKIDPKCEQAYLGMADIYVKKDEPGKAVELLESVENSINTDTIKSKLETAKKQEVLIKLKSAQTGDIVTFGNYEQDGNTGNGAEPIEWLVLDKKDDRMLVISRYGLDGQPYNTIDTAVTWETCTLRNWLNSEFYNTAFSDSEKASVITTTVENPNNARRGTQGGNATSDNVFCLSIDEANRYFASDEARATKPTEYAVSRGASTWTEKDQFAGNCWWWLRSPGSTQSDAADVRKDGYVVDSGFYVYDGRFAVRPALWIAVTNQSEQVQTTTPATAQAPTETTTVASTQPATTAPVKTGIQSAKVGEYITFGSYEQDGNTGNGAEPIEWLVLDKKDDRMLVISRYGLDCQPYNTTMTNVTWETCTLRTWLNKEFYNTAFSDSEKASVITTTVENPNNARRGTQGGNATSDNVFCLSIDEANRYFATKEARATKPTAYAVSRGAYASTSTSWYAGNCWWWLRSQDYGQYDAAYVLNNGDVVGVGNSVCIDTHAVRPALWIALKP